MQKRKGVFELRVVGRMLPIEIENITCICGKTLKTQCSCNKWRGWCVSGISFAIKTNSYAIVEIPLINQLPLSSS